MDNNSGMGCLLPKEGKIVKIADLFSVDGYGVVVTGGASGIGLGYAEALASNGARFSLTVNTSGLTATAKG